MTTGPSVSQLSEAPSGSQTDSRPVSTLRTTCTRSARGKVMSSSMTSSAAAVGPVEPLGSGSKCSQSLLRVNLPGISRRVRSSPSANQMRPVSERNPFGVARPAIRESCHSAQSALYCSTDHLLLSSSARTRINNSVHGCTRTGFYARSEAAETSIRRRYILRQLSAKSAAQALEVARKPAEVP